MRGWRIAAPGLCCLFAAAVLAAPEENPEPPPPGVGVHRDVSDDRTDVVLPGPLVSWAVARRDGGRAVVMLVGPPVDVEAAAGSSGEGGSGRESDEDDSGGEGDDEPCDRGDPVPAPPARPGSLMLFDPAGGGALRPLLESVPARLASVGAADLDGDGIDEILLGGPRRIFVLREGRGDGTPAALEPLIEDPALTGDGAAGALAGRPVSLIGSARFYGSQPSGGWGLIAETAMPVAASRRSGEIRLAGPVLVSIGGGGGRAPLYAAGPEMQGRERLRTILVDPRAPEGARRVETWALLPAPERVLDAAYVTFDGKPALVVTTMSAEKLSLFEEKGLRVYPLEADRSRRGLDPLLAAESRMNIWQAAKVFVHDVNRDGREDLVVGYWKGLKDSRVVLDVHTRAADGSFDPDPGSTEFDVEDADRSDVGYGDDIDGDAIPDLLIRAAGRILVHAGSSRPRDGRTLVETKPRWSVPLEKGGWEGGSAGADFEFGFQAEGGGFKATAPPRMFGRPIPVDFDLDGRSEILIADRSRRGRGRLTVIRFTIPPGP